MLLKNQKRKKMKYKFIDWKPSKETSDLLENIDVILEKFNANK